VARLERQGDLPSRSMLGDKLRCMPVGPGVLIRSRKWSALRAWGMKVAKARVMARARVAVARKLAVTC
jgi:hypothetical protein